MSKFHVALLLMMPIRFLRDKRTNNNTKKGLPECEPKIPAYQRFACSQAKTNDGAKFLALRNKHLEMQLSANFMKCCDRLSLFKH